MEGTPTDPEGKAASTEGAETLPLTEGTSADTPPSTPGDTKYDEHVIRGYMS